MEYRCRIGTPTGEIREEVVVADSESRLRRELEDRGLVLLGARPAAALALKGLALPSLRVPHRRRIASREFLVFNQELATLLKAGMPLVQSLDILRQRVANPTFKSVLDDVHERVRGGAALSEAFEAHGQLFPGVYTASLLAGEKSGGLEQVLRRYVAYVKVVGSLRRKTVSALVYPAILVTLSLFVVVLIVMRVVPAFADFYGNFGRELPAMTRAIIAVSDFVRSSWPVLIMSAAGGSVAIWYGMKQPAQRLRAHRWLLRLPFFGGLAEKFATSQLARTLATLLGGGIPLVNAIAASANAIGNRYVAHEIEDVGQRVREGESMAAAMRARPVFPDVAVKMVEVGESTGALQDMLNSLADFYDEEIETAVGRFITVIEPLLLVVMGIIIAALLLALYMPVFQLSSVVGG
jgi:type IV pilus assembly protein PilC